jgi:hypothetical protein
MIFLGVAGHRGLTVVRVRLNAGVTGCHRLVMMDVVAMVHRGLLLPWSGGPLRERDT